MLRAWQNIRETWSRQLCCQCVLGLPALNSALLLHLRASNRRETPLLWPDSPDQLSFNVAVLGQFLYHSHSLPSQDECQVWRQKWGSGPPGQMNVFGKFRIFPTWNANISGSNATSPVNMAILLSGIHIWVWAKVVWSLHFTFKTWDSTVRLVG